LSNFGQVYLVTGGTSGIGFGIVAHILQHNAAKIFLLSNKEDHFKEALEAFQEYGDTFKVEWVQCNLEDLEQVDKVAISLKQKAPRIDAVRKLQLGVARDVTDMSEDHIKCWTRRWQPQND
jgi:WW domain-containing oxidoreductase